MENNKVKKSKVWIKVVVAVVCVLVIGTTVMAATGAFEKFFNGEEYKEESLYEKYFEKGELREEDSITPKLIEEGYYYEIGQTVEEDIFKIELVGMSGDEDNPVLMFDIYVKDEEIAEKYDILCIEFCALGVEQYENQKDTYGTHIVYAEKSETVSNRYYGAGKCSPAWVGNGKTTVVGIESIRAEISGFKTDDENRSESFELDMEFSFTAPEYCLKSTKYVYYANNDYFFTDEIEDEDRVVKYKLEDVDFGSYSSKIDVNFVEQVANDNGFVDVLTLHSEWETFAADIVLVVDGAEYNCTDCGFTYGDVNEDGLCTLEDNYGMWVEFPGISYYGVQSIEIKCGDEVYTLK